MNLNNQLDQRLSSYFYRIDQVSITHFVKILINLVKLLLSHLLSLSSRLGSALDSLGLLLIQNWLILAIFTLFKDTIIKHLLNLWMHLFSKTNLSSHLLQLLLHLIHLSKPLLNLCLLLSCLLLLLFYLSLWPSSLSARFHQLMRDSFHH